MRTGAEINQISIAVSGDLASIGDLGSNQLNLEGVIGEESKRFLLGENDTLEDLLLSNNFLGGIFNRLVVSLTEVALAAVSIIEEARVSGGTMAQVHSILSLHALTQDVGA